ncbi:tetratricopeptide repeat protein [Streptomyces sp. 6N223]|uniref:tetratricopeptide repeat protein n=1 Tax=Streptomyces sp. 6N223 TaxID=3457412 RepID=UPI003FD3B61F
MDLVDEWLRAVAQGAGGETARSIRTALTTMASRLLSSRGSFSEGNADVATLASLAGAVSSQPDEAALLGILSGFAQDLMAPGPCSPAFPPSVHSNYFTNAERVLAELDRAAEQPYEGGIRGALLYGESDSGKTATASHWAFRRTAHRSYCKAYADLRDIDASQEAQARVYRRLLSQLGMRGEDMPPGMRDRAWHYRRLLHERRAVLVLDNVREVAHVQPFLVPESGVFTIVTTTRLMSLFETHLEVESLSHEATKQLFIKLIGPDAFERTLRTHPTLVERCRGQAAAVLRTVKDLQAGDDSADERFPEDTYERLPPDLARFLNHLTFVPWPEITSGVAAAAAEVTQIDAARMLERLTDLQFLVHEPGRSDRYRFRQGCENYVASMALRREGALREDAAVTRSLEWLLGFAVRADWDAHPWRWPVNDLRERMTHPPFGSSAQALTALIAELDSITQAVDVASKRREPKTTCGLCDAMWAAQLKDGRRQEVLPALRIGVKVADEHVTDKVIVARMHTLLGLALTELGPEGWREAKRELERAERIARASEHILSLATAIESQGLLSLRRGDGRSALRRFEESHNVLAQIREDHPDFAHAERARALLRRNQGRALRLLGRLPEAQARLAASLENFRGIRDEYSQGRTLTDIAWTHFDAGDLREALQAIDQAIPLLTEEGADYHVQLLRRLRRRCEDRLG